MFWKYAAKLTYRACNVPCVVYEDPKFYLRYSSARCFSRHNDTREPSSERWNYWAKNGRQILAESSDFFHAFFRDLLHTANLRHGTDGFTSHPKEGMLRICSPWKIWRLRPGSNPRTWVPKASTLPLHHRSRLRKDNIFKTNKGSCTKSNFALNSPSRPTAGIGVYLYSFFNLDARCGGWSTPHSGGFTAPRKVTECRLHRRLGGPRAGLDGCGKCRLHRDSIPGSPIP